MTTPSRALFWLPLLLIAGCLLHLYSGNTLSLTELMHLIDRGHAHSVRDYQLLQSELPRMVIALLVGALLGLAGSLQQQLTQNRLLSPMTLGTASGAWLSLLVLTIWLPDFAAEHRDLAALSGAILAALLVFVLAGRQGFSGIPVVLSGMAINLLFGAIAAALILLKDQYAQPLFVWSSGDLAQFSWDTVLWLLPRAAIGLPFLLIAPRVLTLLRLGDSAARARGINLAPVFIGFLLLSIWFSAITVAAIGILGFIGLLTPNLARMMGMRSARSELLLSPLLGACMLVMTDSLAMLATRPDGVLVPSGATAALVGIPMLIWLLRRGEGGQVERGGWSIVGRYSRWTSPALIVITVLAILLATLLNHSSSGWSLQWPDTIIWQLRWPGIITAIAGGSGLAVAGVILQRLIRNPLASPDILGISAGASLVIIAGAILGQSIGSWQMIFNALAGSLAVLGLLLLFSLSGKFSAARVAMIGIALSALMDALLQLILTQGGDDAFALMSWMQGATYLVTGPRSLFLLAGVLLCTGATLALSRGITLLGISDAVASARGLPTRQIRALLLLLVGLICALITALVGPLAFIGLLAPHLATLLGARTIRSHLLLATLIGSIVLLLAQALSHTLIAPLTLPVGALTSIIGGTYFIFLLARRRF